MGEGHVELGCSARERPKVLNPPPQGFLHPLGWDGQQGVLQDAAR